MTSTKPSFSHDRVLVLSGQPGKIQELIEVPVPRPRGTSQLISPEFIATKARLEELIHQGHTEDDEEAKTYSMVAHLTDIIDNAE
jgi:NitT/TauT family transport system ATP-binding protein